MDKPEISDPAENETKQLRALRAQYLGLVAKQRWVSEEKQAHRNRNQCTDTRMGLIARLLSRVLLRLWNAGLYKMSGNGNR